MTVAPRMRLLPISFDSHQPRLSTCQATSQFARPVNFAPFRDRLVWKFPVRRRSCMQIMLQENHVPEISPTRFLKDEPLVFHDGVDDDECKPGLIILNQPIADIEMLSRVWNHTGYHLCADGGANQLYDLFVHRPELRTQFVRRLSQQFGLVWA